jgi:hypothetical protein
MHRKRRLADPALLIVDDNGLHLKIRNRSSGVGDISSSIVSWGVGLNQQTIANLITGTIPKFIRRIPCQKSQVSSRHRGEQILASEAGIVLVAGSLLSTRSREDRHANPSSGATIAIAASRKLTFAPAKAIKDVLNGAGRNDGVS